MAKPFLRALLGETLPVPPVWLMRQAGRYLPEYREVRAKAGGFLDLCYTPELAAEVTLQPIRRFGFDAAILFSDILVVPDALGQAVRFEEGEGPRLDPLESPQDVSRLASRLDLGRLAPVMETLRLVKRELPAETALIGFCGAPFTLATYMIAGRGTPDQAPARLWAYRDSESFERLIALLVDASVDYLAAQVEAGAEAVQIFDSWAGVLPAAELKRWSLGPIRAIAEGLKARHPSVPVIAFPRGIGTNYRAMAGLPVKAIGVDWQVDPAWAAATIQPLKTVQGNLDPLCLLGGGEALDRAVDAILASLSAGPFVFNLGHGIMPQTPIAHVERMMARIRSR